VTFVNAYHWFISLKPPPPQLRLQKTIISPNSNVCQGDNATIFGDFHYHFFLWRKCSVFILLSQSYINGPLHSWRSFLSHRLITSCVSYWKFPAGGNVYLPPTNSVQTESQPPIRWEKINSVVWVRERTIPTERPPLVGEATANLCG
jgi:hypothetical protein